MNSFKKFGSLIIVFFFLNACASKPQSPPAPGPCDHIKDACLKSACNMLGFEPKSEAALSRFRCGGRGGSGSETEWEIEQLERRVFDLEMKERYGK